MVEGRGRGVGWQLDTASVQEGYRGMHFGVAGPGCAQGTQVRVRVFLSPDQTPAEHTFPSQRRTTPKIWRNIVDVLQEDDITPQVVQICQQGAVATLTKY